MVIIRIANECEKKENEQGFVERYSLMLKQILLRKLAEKCRCKLLIFEEITVKKRFY